MIELPPARPLEGELELAIDADIRGGCKNEQERIADDFHVLSYFNLEGHRHLPSCEREEYECHRKTHPLTRRTVEILTSLTYSHPPVREILDDDHSQEFLQEVYRDNDVDGLLAQADEMATLLGVSAVYAAPTVDSLKPIKLFVYDASQLILYEDPDDCTKIAHVVVVSRYDQRTRYDWWSKDFRRVYITQKAQTGSGWKTSGGRAAEYREDLSHENVYGRLPFAFFHAKRPTSSLTTGGIGEWLSKFNASIDATLYEQALAIRHYYLPKGWVAGAPPDWQPTSTRDGEYMRLPHTLTGMDGSAIATVGFLQAQLEIDQGILNIESLINTALAGIGVPRSMYSLDSTGFASGDAIQAEQRPLIDLTVKRQSLLTASEGELAEVVLAVGGGWSGDETLQAAGLGGVNLSVQWPNDFDVLSESERAAQDAQDLEQGMVSLVDLTMRKFKFASEEEALQHLMKIKEDNDRLRDLGILPSAPTPPV